jgi:dihydrofolate reductase
VSTTLPEPEATRENTRVFRDVGMAVVRLKAEPGRGILVLNSAKLIQYMLAADPVDDLRLAVVAVSRLAPLIWQAVRSPMRS